ncbi:Tigger transposable element-derived protein 2 [Trichinella nativa]|uniref:Tigger transposable element-derived protein 2 n=1 Tax=Trichinella nativa TaxID=6335 RepID=A0A0V1L135_9BILA|nr:Tigger transposable element-derived protein 2 [Trichinella nativa]
MAQNYKSHHGVHLLKIHDVTYDLDFVYHADETGLVWKCLLERSLVSMTEETANCFKPCKEIATHLCCANAAGIDRLQLLLAGKSKRP